MSSRNLDTVNTRATPIFIERGIEGSIGIHSAPCDHKAFIMQLFTLKVLLLAAIAG